MIAYDDGLESLVGGFEKQSFVEFGVQSISLFKLRKIRCMRKQAGVPGWSVVQKRLDQWGGKLKTMRLVFTYLPAR